MRWDEAVREGFGFTGMTWDKWDENEGNRQKEKAARIKRMFKGADYRIVTGTKDSWLGNNSKAIMGNEIFLMCQYFNKENEEKILNNFDKEKEELQKKYEEELTKLKNEYSERLNRYNKIVSLMK